MGCRSWTHRGVEFRFPETDDSVACLCAWTGGDTDPRHVRSLAYLGAGVVLAEHGDYDDGDTVHLPGMLPESVRQAIDAAVKEPKP